MLLPKLDVVVVFLRVSLPASLSHSSRSCVPCVASVATVQENVLWMDGFTLDHPIKYSNKNTKTHGTD